MSESASSPVVVCPECVKLRALLEAALQRIAELEAEVGDLRGQPGHPGHHRQRLPAERVNHVVRYVPTTCLRCRSPLPEEPAPDDPEPQWHQVAELPEIAAVVTEYQGHSRTCPECGLLNCVEIPPEVRTHVIGPRLAAVMSYFSGRHHNGKRGVQEIVGTVFQVPV